MQRSVRRTAGFTLIEILITVAIISILAAIAIPGYRDYVQRGKVTEAHATLSDLRLRAEKWFADNRSYVPGTPDWRTISGTKYFTYDCNTPAITATAFTCTATGAAGEGMSGFSFTINESNTRTSTFSSPSSWTTPSPNTCWVRRKGDGC